jgi:RND superfamily putative drug exporter
MNTLLSRLGGAAARRPWRVLAAWLLAAVAVVGIAATAGGTLADDYTMPGTDSQHANDLLEARFPAQAGATARIVLHARDRAVPVASIASVSERVRRLPHVTGITPAGVAADGRTAVLAVQYDVPVTAVQPKEAAAALESAAAPARAAGLTTEFGGEVLDNVYEQGKADVIGFGLAAVILLVAFGSALAAGLPLAIAALGLGIGMTLVSVLAAFTHVSTIAPTLAAMVGIGVGIDYSLFIVARHRQQLLEGMAVHESVARAIGTAGRSVVFAGSTVLVAICGLAFSGVPNFVTMGFATAIVVAVSMVAAITLLPALLGLAGKRVLPRRVRRQARSLDREPAASRWARQVTRRPWPYLLGSLAVLVALAAPTLSLQLGQSDAGSEPTSNTDRRAYDLVAQGLGRGANGPLLLVADLKRLPFESLPALGAKLASLPGVVSVSPVTVSPNHDAAVITVVPSTGPQEDATDALVRSLRRDVLPAGVSVTGPTAAYIDFNRRLQDRLPLVIGVVVAASFLLLVLVFRSVIAPAKAAVLNLLSIGAAYGAIVALFQWGWGTSLLGLERAVPVTSFVPMFMFAILFGLSMDYEVFLLSRIREEWDRTGDSRESVVAGLAGTGRVITSAALIMVAVFAGFALDTSVTIKMMGVGMAVAIFVDATVVRMVLVPATMVLLGRWNWWLPAWLDRLLPQVSLQEPSAVVPGPRASEREPALV